MLQPTQDLIDRLEAFSDTEYLANKLYDIAHDEEIEDLPTEAKYYLMESIENLTELYDLCKQLAHHLNVEAFNNQNEYASITPDSPQHDDL